MTYDRINAAKNVLGSIGSAKNILQNINLSSKVVQSVSKERNNWRNNDNNNNVNDNMNDKNKNKNKNKNNEKNSDKKNNHDNTNEGNIINDMSKLNISIKERRSKGPGLALSYCIAFSPDLKKCLCNVHEDHVTIRTARIITITMSDFLQDKMTSYEMSMKAMANKLLSRDKYYDKRRILQEGNEDEDKDKNKSHCARYAAVTLITVGWAHEYDEGTMDQILESWCGPKVTNTPSFILCY